MRPAGSLLAISLVLVACSSAVRGESLETAAATGTETPGPTASTPVATASTPIATPLPTPKTTDWPAGAVGTAGARERVGQSATVCGAVVSANWAMGTTGLPTFLNLDTPHPNEAFNVVIWGEQRRAYADDAKPEIAYLGRTICVTGVIEAYQGWVQIAGASMESITVVPGT